MSWMVSEWFREVPDDPGSVRNGPGSVRNGFGHIWKVRKDRKVMEGSARVRDMPGYLRKSGWFHNRCSHVALRGKESFLSPIRIQEKKQFWSRFRMTKTYRNSSKIGGRFVDDPRGLATYKRAARGAPRGS